MPVILRKIDTKFYNSTSKKQKLHVLYEYQIYGRIVTNLGQK